MVHGLDRDSCPGQVAACVTRGTPCIILVSSIETSHLMSVFCHSSRAGITSVKMTQAPPPAKLEVSDAYYWGPFRDQSCRESPIAGPYSDRVFVGLQLPKAKLEALEVNKKQWGVGAEGGAVSRPLNCNTMQLEMDSNLVQSVRLAPACLQRSVQLCRPEVHGSQVCCPT